MSHMDWAWAQPATNWREKLVLVTVAHLADERGLENVTAEEVISLSEMSPASVSNHLATLKKRGCYLLAGFPAGRSRRRAIPTAVRRLVIQRDEKCCCECGSTESLQLDHIHPWSDGGTDDLENLQLLCRRCNIRKGARV